MAHDEPKKPFPLLAYLDEIAQDLMQLIAPAINASEKQPIHKARVSTRRLKAAMLLTETVISHDHRKALLKTTKSLRRNLGALRDLDVMLEHLEEIKAPKHADAVRWMTDQLKALREKAAATAREEAPPAKMLSKMSAWWSVRGELIEAQPAIDSLLAESVHLQLDAFVEQADVLVQRHAMLGAEAAKKSGHDDQPHDPHALRIAGKSLRYTLEMAKAHEAKLPGGAIALFKKMQESLGLWHDLVVLTQCMLRQSIDHELALHDPDLQKQLLTLAQATMNRAQIELGKVATLWMSRGTELTGRLRGAFPLTKSAAPAKSEAPAKQINEAKDAEPRASAEPEPVASTTEAPETEPTSQAPADASPTSENSQSSSAAYSN